MKKSEVTAALERIRLEAETKPIDNVTALQVIAVLVDYINDPQIREAVDEIPF